MIDPKIDIKKFTVKEEQATKAWLGTNWIPFALGFVTGIVLVLLLGKL